VLPKSQQNEPFSTFVGTTHGILSLPNWESSAMRRAVAYLRVSTIDQTTANQERELR
jgi:hypothetical protein